MRILALKNCVVCGEEFDAQGADKTCGPAHSKVLRNERVRKRVARGLCRACGKPAAPGITLCKTCAKKENERSKELYNSLTPYERARRNLKTTLAEAKRHTKERNEEMETLYG